MIGPGTGTRTATYPRCPGGARRRVLFIASSWPHGDAFGGQLRALHTARALGHIGDVTVTVVGSAAAHAEAQRKTEAEFSVLPPVAPRAAPNRSVVEKLRWGLDVRYLNVHGCTASEEDRVRICSYASQCDLVWLLNSRTPNILQQWRWPHAHLDVDDLPSAYCRSVAQHGSSPSARLKANIQQRLLLRRERLLDRRFTSLSVCSDADRQYLACRTQVHVIPNGFERPSAEPAPNPTKPPRIGFIGLYSYPPNLDGVRWFLRECWPLLRQVVPGIRLRIVGRESDGTLKPDAPDVDALGWMSDPTQEVASWSCMIVPIRLGAGTRVKIADAFSRKCPVVSTSLGAFGYDVRDGEELRIADTPQDFAAAAMRLIQNRPEAERMAERAWRSFVAKWTWDAIAPRIWEAAEDCLRRSSAELAMNRFRQCT